MNNLKNIEQLSIEYHRLATLKSEMRQRGMQILQDRDADEKSLDSAKQLWIEAEELSLLQDQYIERIGYAVTRCGIRVPGDADEMDPASLTLFLRG